MCPRPSDARLGRACNNLAVVMAVLVAVLEPLDGNSLSVVVAVLPGRGGVRSTRFQFVRRRGGRLQQFVRRLLYLI